VSALCIKQTLRCPHCLHNRRLRQADSAGTSQIHPGTSQSCIRIIRIGWYSICCRLGNGGHDDTGAVLSLHTQRALPCGQLAQTDRWFSRLGKAWRTRWIPWHRCRRPTGALPGGRLMTSFATRAGTQGRLVGRVRLPLCPTTAAAAPARRTPARSLHPAYWCYGAVASCSAAWFGRQTHLIVLHKFSLAPAQPVEIGLFVQRVLCV